jgi:hypothetical protein
MVFACIYVLAWQLTAAPKMREKKEWKLKMNS